MSFLIEPFIKGKFIKASHRIGIKQKCRVGADEGPVTSTPCFLCQDDRVRAHAYQQTSMRIVKTGQWRLPILDGMSRWFDAYITWAGFRVLWS
jgi:hypothetical protein